MSDGRRRHIVLEVPWRTLLKIIAAAALVWCLLWLADIILVILVAIILAVVLDPPVCWIQNRGLPRAAAASLVGLLLLVLIGGFLWVTWATLTEQAQYLSGHFVEIEQQILKALPDWARGAAGSNGAQAKSYLGDLTLRFGRSALYASGLIVLGFVLTIYFLTEGERTYRWLLAFIPPQYRPRMERTVRESREAVFAYMVGNVITSVIAAVCTLVALWLLKVPAALLLALMAGLSDFVPVIGFVVSSIPAIALAMTVSAKTTLIVIAFYIAYNTVENYVISPWAYGDRMKLSDLAVILAFAAGAQLGGVIGALIALPIAALYPTIERIWLRERLPDDTVRQHARMAQD
jgi:predicted PurR-regulated permease PerM